MSKRSKGYMEWSPTSEVSEIIANTHDILREYGAYGPMTVRQIFYRLVGNYGYDKTERAYKRLAEYLVKARRAQMISFSSIRDGGGKSVGGPDGYSSLDNFLDELSDYSRHFWLDRTIGQPNVIELWCEAEGMVPMLEQMVRPWRVQVTGSGGFSSVTVTHEFARRVLSRSVPTVLLHVGDFDPSGESIFESMCQDIGKFVVETEGGRFNPQTGETLELSGYDDQDHAPFFLPHRIALTAEQVDDFGLPTAPPKSSDSRSAKWVGETTQAEAMDPPLLATVVTDAVKEYVDQDLYDAIARQEKEERGLVGDRVSDAIDAIREEIEDGR